MMNTDDEIHHKTVETLRLIKEGYPGYPHHDFLTRLLDMGLITTGGTSRCWVVTEKGDAVLALYLAAKPT